MSRKNIKQLLIVSFLGFTLVGCTSTQEIDDQSDYPNLHLREWVNAQEIDDQSDYPLETSKVVQVQTPKLQVVAPDKAVHFDFDSSSIKSENYAIIKNNVKYMTSKKNLELMVTGHADERGSREYNLALGERRANAVKHALIAEGISPSRITVNSLGEEDPVGLCHSENCWSKNRRTKFSY